MRPKSMLWFDRLLMASLALSLPQAFISYAYTQAQLSVAYPETANMLRGPGLYIFNWVIGIGITLLLWWLVSRRASNVAKWILTVLTGFGAAMWPTTLFEPGIGAPQVWLAFAINAVSIAAVYFLFRKDSRDWLDSKGKIGPVDPNVFN